MSAAADLLQLTEVTAVFDGFKALDISYFAVDRGELRVVIGPNGAGKTTLCDVISGKTAPTSGRVVFDDHDITGWRDTAIAALGVGRKFQTPSVFDSLTVAENLELALPGRRSVWGALVARLSSEERDRIDAQLKRVRLDRERDRPARLLSHGQRQWLEISMLMLSRPRLLLVDEPAAGLTDHETALTAELLLELKGEHTLIVIEHDMSFVRRLGGIVTVLCEGKVLAQGPLDQVSADERVRAAYLGRAKKAG
ncbi:MAG: urea ABC transporter ATP-binding protein UrtD [Planctomycetes bacterium]|nr:urea ABC transporter ATP-binding protein UrtD [Planctomycetota bacterium]